MMGNIPQSLRDAIRANTVIPFVGAGVSMSINDKDGKRVFPSWKELLEAAAQRLIDESKDDDANLVHIYIKKNNYQQAADAAYEGLKGEVWNRFFNNQFDKDPDSFESSSVALPKAVWQLGNKIITLNYDKVMEWGYGSNSSKVAILDNNSVAELADFQRKENDKPTVWHLHGKIDNRAELILTAEGYRKLYDSNNSSYRAALETLRVLSVSHSFLFIGCSLDDAEILSEINRQQELFSGNSKKHYVLVRQGQENEIKAKFKNIDIQIITFEDFGSPLVRLVDSLSEQKNDKEESIAVKSAKNEQSKVLSEQPAGSKIALLSANPLDFPQSYPKFIKEIKKIHCVIDHYNLSIENLNSLDDYTHIIILSQITNNRILIEDDFFCSKKIYFSELEANIDGSSVQGIYIFTNSLPNKKAIDNLILPFLFLSDVENNDVDNLWFQLYKKNNLKFFKNIQTVNEHQFKHPILSSNIKNKIEKFKDETSLPSSIDEKSIRNFVGRLDDIGTIGRKLLALEDEGGFLTVKGSGGIGKTTIVKKLTIALAERGLFKGGITFVDCEFIVDYSQFEYKVADAFNLEQAEDVRQHLQDHFDDEKRLIILDNFETLLHLNDSDTIKDFLKFVCDYASIIVTSREVLQLENEGEAVHVIRQLTTDEAVDVFFSGCNMIKENFDDKEIRLLRQDILENLLDNNPLAINLITHNMPSVKCLTSLKNELESDFFNKISDVDLQLFDNKENLNISRKKSIYASILYSYNYLSETDKKAFELLSLFPDGIDQENFKKISQDVKAKNKKIPLITDPVIKSLEDKSMIERNQEHIKLQSILGKFAESKLKQRENIESYYRNAIEYNIAFAKFLRNLLSEKPNVALRIFNHQQKNFLESILYYNSSVIDDNNKILDYFDDLTDLFIDISSTKFFIKLLNGKAEFFVDKEKLCIDVMVLHAMYYGGDFKKAFLLLQSLVPLNFLTDIFDEQKKCVKISLIERLTFNRVLDIYSMEGNEFYLSKSLSENYSGEEGLGISIRSLFMLGERDSQFAKLIKSDFIYFDLQASVDDLSIDEIDKYIERIYEKDYIEKMQVSYVRSKIVPLEKSKIDILVIINPYTRGLKDLMLAFVEDDIDKSKALYVRAIDNLEHIKYYYVEANFLYSKFLYENTQSEFNEFYSKGLVLSKKHCYRFLQYRFEQLINPTGQSYDPKNYPLPDGLDFLNYYAALSKRKK